MNAPDPRPAKSNLGKDMAIFLDGGFILTLLILLGLCAVATAIMLYASDKYGVPVLQQMFSALPAASA